MDVQFGKRMTRSGVYSVREQGCSRRPQLAEQESRYLKNSIVENAACSDGKFLTNSS
jgi:hypothetical protein